jgi:dihydroorotase
MKIREPDDLHVHLRDGEMLKLVLPFTARQFQRALVMPNLKPPVTTTEQALEYYQRIKSAVPETMHFEPLMSLYLTDHTSPMEIEKTKQSGRIVACKLYPSGATTNSDSGVTDIQKLDPVFKKMSELDILLLVHGEMLRDQETGEDIDVFDRESQFLHHVLDPILQRHPNLKIVLEHITTKVAVDFVRSRGGNLAATITAHHLLVNRNHMLSGGIRPHLYCLPILKREEDRQALLEAATSGDPCFFLGTDSAPHTREAKESECGCAGSFTAPIAMELYATAFDSVGCLDKLEDFSSTFGAEFYGLPLNSSTIELNRLEVCRLQSQSKDVVQQDIRLTTFPHSISFSFVVQ